MKEILKPEDLSNPLSQKEIEILAKMIDMIPQPKEWHQIMDILSYENYEKVETKRLELQ